MEGKGDSYASKVAKANSVRDNRCSDHFTDDDFEDSGPSDFGMKFRRKLKATAIPAIATRPAAMKRE